MKRRYRVITLDIVNVFKFCHKTLCLLFYETSGKCSAKAVTFFGYFSTKNTRLSFRRRIYHISEDDLLFC